MSVVEKIEEISSRLDKIIGSLKGKAVVPRELLEQLAPAEPINQDEMGGCAWCGAFGETTYSYVKRGDWHQHDCPWLRMRHLLGDPGAGNLRGVE